MTVTFTPTARCSDRLASHESNELSSGGALRNPDVACPVQHVIWSRHLVALERTEELTLVCIQNREREPCFAMLG